MMLYTDKAVSPRWTVNKADLIKILRDTAIFFGAPTLMYLGQLSGTLTQHGVLKLPDLTPTVMTIGAIEGWAISIAINFFLKLNDPGK